MKSTNPGFLAKLCSPVGAGIILGLFAVYALIIYAQFDVLRPDGGRDPLLLFGLISQFVGLLCLLVMFRALRDGRAFETLFVVMVVMPLNAAFMQTAIHAASGKPLTLEALAQSSIFFNRQIFSPLMWAFLGMLSLALGAAWLWMWRQRAHSSGSRTSGSDHAV